MNLVEFLISFSQIEPPPGDDPEDIVIVKPIPFGVTIISTLSLTKFCDPLTKNQSVLAARPQVESLYLQHRKTTSNGAIFDAISFWTGYTVNPVKWQQVRAAFLFAAIIDFRLLAKWIGAYRARRAVAKSFRSRKLPNSSRLKISRTSIYRASVDAEAGRKFTPELLEIDYGPVGRPKRASNG